MTTHIKKREYLSYFISNHHPELKYFGVIDERGKFVLYIIPKQIPYDWTRHIVDILKDTIDIMAESYTHFKQFMEFKILLKTILVNWSKGISYEEVHSMSHMLCHRFENQSSWESVEGSTLSITSMGSTTGDLLTITSDNSPNYRLIKEDEDLIVESTSGLRGIFKGCGIESLQRAYICTYLFSEFHI